MAKTISDKLMRVGDVFGQSHDDGKRRLYRVYPNEDDEEEADEVGLLWVSVFMWGKESYPKDKKAVGVGLYVVSSKTNPHGEREVLSSWSWREPRGRI